MGVSFFHDLVPKGEFFSDWIGRDHLEAGLPPFIARRIAFFFFSPQIADWELMKPAYQYGERRVVSIHNGGPCGGMVLRNTGAGK